MTDYDRLMERLATTIEHIVDIDLPQLPVDDRVALVGHLTGAAIVTVMDHERQEAG